jgi:preprotein translocase subunit SecA
MPEGSLPVSAYDEAPVEEAGDDLGEALYAIFLKKEASWPKVEANEAERQIALAVIDNNWTRHIDTMAHPPGRHFLTELCSDQSVTGLCERRL